jgi:hypothetical protein
MHKILRITHTVMIDIPVSMRKWAYIKNDIPKRNSGIARG